MARRKPSLDELRRTLRITRVPAETREEALENERERCRAERRAGEADVNRLYYPDGRRYGDPVNEPDHNEAPEARQDDDDELSRG